MSFTQGIKISSIDDYITPSQVCVVPVKVDGISRTGPKIVLKGDGEINPPREKVSITLTDCLACSGCITTAETILINEQSDGEFLKQIKELKSINKDSLAIVSLSPQSIASLSVRFNLGNMYNAEIKLRNFFRSLSVDIVLNTTFGRDLSLLELANDVYKKVSTVSTPGSPVIASACPGWVCYAEKHKENKLLVPLISNVRSPQHMMGLLVKKALSRRFKEYTNTQIFHVAIMPCYDKKLEASRNEFSFTIDDNGDRIKEVDIVLSSMEVESMIIGTGYDFDNNVDSSEQHIVERWLALRNEFNKEVCYNDDDSGSGGYLDSALRHCAQRMYGYDLAYNLCEDSRITISRIKDNFQMVTLHSDDDLRSPLLKFAYAYGFKNIQNIVHSLRKKSCKFDFVEIMACPGGCINGGGQIRAPEMSGQKALLDQVTVIYKSPQRQRPTVNPTIKEMYEEWIDRTELHTTYNIVPPLPLINTVF